MKNKRSIGAAAEQQALQYLKKQGLRPITRNYYCRSGEIDLIMQDKEELVFVEVRYRDDTSYGDGATTVHYHKQRKLIKAATVYLLSKNQYDHPCRFDVISMTDNYQTIDWVKNAFDVS